MLAIILCIFFSLCLEVYTYTCFYIFIHTHAGFWRNLWGPLLWNTYKCQCKDVGKQRLILYSWLFYKGSMISMKTDLFDWWNWKKKRKCVFHSDVNIHSIFPWRKLSGKALSQLDSITSVWLASVTCDRATNLYYSEMHIRKPTKTTDVSHVWQVNIFKC